LQRKRGKWSCNDVYISLRYVGSDNPASAALRSFPQMKQAVATVPTIPVSRKVDDDRTSPIADTTLGERYHMY
jgi:hypothetical protein